MPPNNQSPLSGIFNLFKGFGSDKTPSLPGRSGGYPGFGGNPGRAGGFPGLGGRPNTGSGGGFFPGFGGGSSRGGGMFNLGDIMRNLSKMDISKLMDGINNFRNMMANAQKVAQTLNQLGITVGNVQKIMKQIDINGLMNLLQGGGADSSTESTPQQDSPTDQNSGASSSSSSPKKKKKSTSTKKTGGTKRKSAKGKSTKKTVKRKQRTQS